MSPFPRISPSDTAWITTADMIEVDRLMIDEYGITLIQMMENAGRNLARVALDRFEATSATVLAGTGGNGGGGLVAARHLANAGVGVEVCLTRSADDLGPVPRHQFDALQRMGVAIVDEPTPVSDVVLDAMVGYSLRGAPRGRTAELIAWVAGADAPVLSLDTPSGLDVTTGATPGPAVNAGATMTLALPKTGLRTSSAVGELYLADISIPRSLYEQLGIGPLPSFRPGPILAVDRA